MLPATPRPQEVCGNTRIRTEDAGVRARNVSIYAMFPVLIWWFRKEPFASLTTRVFSPNGSKLAVRVGGGRTLDYLHERGEFQDTHSALRRLSAIFLTPRHRESRQHNLHKPDYGHSPAVVLRTPSHRPSPVTDLLRQSLRREGSNLHLSGNNRALCRLSYFASVLYVGMTTCICLLE